MTLADGPVFFLFCFFRITYRKSKILRHFSFLFYFWFKIICNKIILPSFMPYFYTRISSYIKLLHDSLRKSPNIILFQKYERRKKYMKMVQCFCCSVLSNESFSQGHQPASLKNSDHENESFTCTQYAHQSHIKTTFHYCGILGLFSVLQSFIKCNLRASRFSYFYQNAGDTIPCCDFKEMIFFFSSVKMPTTAQFSVTCVAISIHINFNACFVVY